MTKETYYTPFNASACSGCVLWVRAGRVPVRQKVCVCACVCVCVCCLCVCVCTCRCYMQRIMRQTVKIVKLKPSFSRALIHLYSRGEGARLADNIPYQRSRGRLKDNEWSNDYFIHSCCFEQPSSSSTTTTSSSSPPSSPGRSCSLHAPARVHVPKIDWSGTVSSCVHTCTYSMLTRMYPPPHVPKWCTAELGRLPDRHGAWPE